MKHLLLLLPLAFVLTGASASVRAANDVSQQAVEEALTCQCGCGLTVANCNHLNCSFSVPLRKEIRTMVERGMEQDEILIRFRQKYGEKILSSPVPEGFNLVAWILPFVVLAGGGLLVVRIVRCWSRATGEGEDSSGGAGSSISGDERKRLEEELSRDR